MRKGKLVGPRQAGDCLTFHPQPNQGDLLLRPTDSWEDLLARLPAGWRPDLVVLSLTYGTIPDCLWSAPVPRLALASDWNLLWHYYRRRLPACDVVVSDTMGAELLGRLELTRVVPGNLCGCDCSFTDAPPPETPRDIDILVVGNFNPAVQRERMPWLGRLARLSHRRRVVFRTGIFGPSYRHLLGRTRIVFHASNRHKVGPRAFEAAAAGALIFQECGNRELPQYFRDRRECILYDDAEVEYLLEHYLDNEDERRATCGGGAVARRQLSFRGLLGRGPGDRRADARVIAYLVCSRAEKDPSRGTVDALLAGVAEQSVGGHRVGGRHGKALDAEPTSAVLHNALGVMLGRQVQGRSSATAAAVVAVDCFRRALACQPDFVVAGLNLAEALAAADQELAAIEAGAGLSSRCRARRKSRRNSSTVCAGAEPSTCSGWNGKGRHGYMPAPGR